MKAKYIPNILSVIRILLVFTFAAAFFWCDSKITALAIFVLSGVTDAVDGRLARHFGWVSQAGKILDPVADKLMQCTVLLCLAIGGYAPLWIFIFYAVKELTMALGSVLFFKRNREIGVSMKFGKFAAVLFYVAIGLLILLKMIGVELPPLVVHGICAVTAIVAVLAMVFYYRAYMRAEKSEREAKKKAKLRNNDPA